MAVESASAGTLSDMRPPRSEVGVVGWLRKNLFSSWSNGILTLLGLWIIYRVLAGVLDWAVFSAVWSGQDGSACRSAEVGACWPFVAAKFGQFMYGRYPDAERWRVVLTYVLSAATLLTLMVPVIPGKTWAALFGIFGLPVSARPAVGAGVPVAPEAPEAPVGAAAPDGVL